MLCCAQPGLCGDCASCARNKRKKRAAPVERVRSVHFTIVYFFSSGRCVCVCVSLVSSSYRLSFYLGRPRRAALSSFLILRQLIIISFFSPLFALCWASPLTFSSFFDDTQQHQSNVHTRRFFFFFFFRFTEREKRETGHSSHKRLTRGRGRSRKTAARFSRTFLPFFFSFFGCENKKTGEWDGLRSKAFLPRDLSKRYVLADGKLAGHWGCQLLYSSLDGLMLMTTFAKMRIETIVQWAVLDSATSSQSAGIDDTLWPQSNSL